MLKASEAGSPRVSSDLSSRSIGESAEKAILSLPVPRDRAFAALYNYLAVDEPAVHLMPLHFLPRSAQRTVEHSDLHCLGVAAKLEYVRSRWIDEIVDSGCTESLLATHDLHREIVELIFALYAKVLHGGTASEFFRTLAGLYAHHGASLAVDGSRLRRPLGLLTEDQYSAQVHARNGSFRASIDAVLLLAGASKKTVKRARQSWHLWVLGAQLYDDALDVEEDFESESLTWTVVRTLADLGANAGENPWPDRDTFYETALVGGAVVETLARAEACFRSAADLSDDEFPSWAVLQRACISQTTRLQADFHELAARIARRQESRRNR